MLGQYNKSFILCALEEQFYLIDQHSLDEAIHFEKMKNGIQQLITC